MRIFLIKNEGAEFSAPSRLSIKVQTVKNSNALSLCHSEERSDEESFCYRYCEDPSLSLRMTWQETGFRHRRIYALLAFKYESRRNACCASIMTYRATHTLPYLCTPTSVRCLSLNLSQQSISVS